MSDLLLTLYQDDDETVLFTVSTSPTHPHPYLCEPQVYAESEIDLQRGSARIGRLDVEIIDPQTGPDQTRRWLTERLGTAEGYSALNGRRVRLEHDDGTVVIDGIVAGVALHNSFAGFRVSIEDIRARGIEIPLFTRTRTTAVLPRGVVPGYGRTAAGQWMVPPATGIIGRYRALEAGQGVIEFPVLRSGDSRRVMHDDIRTAVQTGWDAELEQMVYPTVEVWWRPQGATEWRIHRRMPTPTYTFGSSPDELLQMGPDLIATTKSLGRGDDTDYVSRIFLAATAEQPVLPTTGQNVEVMLVYSGPITERFPLHYEGPAGALLLDVLRGEYSTDEQGAQIDPRIRVDEARFIGPAAPAVLRAPVRVRITETEEDLRDWFERACQALGIAPALNAHGEVSPVSAELPDETVPLPEINDGNAEAVAGWEHPITDAITQVHVTYHRDISHAGARVAVPRGTGLSGGAADGISSVERSITIAPDEASGIQQVMGIKVHKVDGFLWRSIGGEEGQGSPALSDDAAVREARRLAGDLLLRFAHGGQSSFVRVRKSDPDIEALTVGDWVLDARSWAPNYMSGRRGRNHLAQVVSIRDINPEWREIRLLDAAPHAHPTPQPTLGSLSEPAPGVVAVPVTSVPAGAEARVDYAVSPTLPDTDSGLWTMLDRTRTPRTLRTPPLPTGSTVWIRARGEQVGRRPSAWTPALSIVLSDTALVYRLYVRISESGAVVVSADLSALTQGVRIYYVVHPVGTQPPPLVDYHDFPAAPDVWTLPDVFVRPGEAITVELEPWTGWTGSAVSGAAGVRMSRLAIYPVDETSFEIHNVLWEEGDDGHGTLNWDIGTQITDSFLGYAIVPAPETEAKWEEARANLTRVTSPVRLRMPRELATGAEVGLVWLEAKYDDPAGNGLATGDVHSMRIFPRTSIPAIDDQTGDLRDGAVKRRGMVGDGVITARTMREGIQTFNTDVVFSASSNLEVEWSAGRIALADGRIVTVTAGTTGPMSGPTWVYLDLDAPGSQLRVTRNIASTIGDGRVLLAYARPISDPSQLAFFVPAVGLFGVNGDAISPESIRTNHIAAGQVVAGHVSSISLSVIQAAVNQLSAITADLGEVRTGLIVNSAEDPTRAIRLSDEDALPGTAVDFLDLGATGIQPVLQVGGMRVLATGETIVVDPQIKKMRLSHHAFRPFTNNMQYGATETRTTSPDAFTEWGAAFSLPVGSRIIRVRDRAGAGENGNTVVFRLYRQDEFGNVQVIWESVIHQAFIGTGQSPELDEVVEAGYSYAFYYQTIRDQPGPGTPAFEWAEVEYEATNYRQTL